MSKIMVEMAFTEYYTKSFGLQFTYIFQNNNILFVKIISVAALQLTQIYIAIEKKNKEMFYKYFPLFFHHEKS